MNYSFIIQTLFCVFYLIIVGIQLIRGCLVWKGTGLRRERERERERGGEGEGRESSVFRERVSLLCTLSPVGREERRYNNNKNILVLLNTY